MTPEEREERRIAFCDRMRRAALMLRSAAGLIVEPAPRTREHLENMAKCCDRLWDEATTGKPHRKHHRGKEAA
jgi:hypothetical protein